MKMLHVRRLLASALILTVVTFVHASALPARENARIEYLLVAVANLQNATFIRNGTSYGAAEAADHLRLKLNKAGAAVKSAEDFIRLCGTQSSTSGVIYELRFADGRIIPSAEFLRSKLAEYDALHAHGA
jgi:hypothetical protein